MKEKYFTLYCKIILYCKIGHWVILGGWGLNYLVFAHCLLMKRNTAYVTSHKKYPEQHRSVPYHVIVKTELCDSAV